MATRVTQQDVEALIAEIDAYLGAVDAFRAEGCEPRWRGEPTPSAAVVSSTSRQRRRTARRKP